MPKVVNPVSVTWLCALLYAGCAGLDPESGASADAGGGNDARVAPDGTGADSVDREPVEPDEDEEDSVSDGWSISGLDVDIAERGGAELRVAPAVPEFGTPETVRFESVVGVPWVYSPMDLAFADPEKKHLWVLSRGDDGLVHLTLGADGNPGPQKFIDYSHSLADETTGLSISPLGYMATSEEALNTVNGVLDGDGKSGVSVWPAEVEAFASGSGTWPQGALVDRLTGCSPCMGVEWVEDMTFFVVEGEKGHLEKYNFGRPGKIGEKVPQGGAKYRVVASEIVREPNVPAHMAFDRETRRLYVADPGNHRVLWVDVDSGAPGAIIFNNSDPGTTYKKWVNAIWDVMDLEGELVLPSGMLFHRNRLFVSDHATGLIQAFELDGSPLGTLDTGRGYGAVAGLEMDGEGRLLFADSLNSEVVRVVP